MTWKFPATPFGWSLTQTDDAADARDAIGAVSADDVADILADEATVVAAAESAVSAKVLGLDLLSSDDPRAPNWNYNPDYGLVIHDASRRILVHIAANGATRIARLDMASIPDGGITAAMLDEAVRNSLVADVGYMMKPQSPMTGFLAAIVDASNRVLLGIREDGTLVGRFIPPVGSLTEAELETSLAQRIPPHPYDEPPVPEIVGTTPDRKLYLCRSSGRKLVDTNDPREDSLVVMPDNTVLYTSSAGRRAALTNGDVVPATPDWSKIVCWGDSLTNYGVGGPYTSVSLSYPGQLDPLVAASVVNRGLAGITADHIAILQGGYTLELTVSGGAIPASGPVTVTSTQDYVLKNGPYTLAGSLNGISGSLVFNPANPFGQYEFTRTTSGSAVPCTGTIPFISDLAEPSEKYPVVIFPGRNDLAWALPDAVQRVTAATAAMVARLKVYRREYIVMGTINGTGAVAGSQQHTDAVAINAAFAETYGSRYLDIRRYLVDQAIHDLGITPTAADILRMNNDALPPSIMVTGDATHYSPATAALVAAQVKSKIDQLGWML